jgi:hypothetical protein
VCICSLRNPARNAHAPYYLWPAALYNVFLHYLINGKKKKKKVLNTKCVFWFSLQFLSETFLIIRRNEWDMIKKVYRSSCKVPVIRVRLWWKLDFLDKFPKNPKILNVMKIPPVEAEFFHANRRTERRDEANSRFSQFCERA